MEFVNTSVTQLLKVYAPPTKILKNIIQQKLENTHHTRQTESGKINPIDNNHTNKYNKTTRQTN